MVLHPTDTIPDYDPIGKIAGQKEVQLVDVSSGKEKVPYLITVFGGGFWTQVLRAIGYSAVMLLLLFLLAKIADDKSVREQTKRNIIVDRFVDRYSDLYNIEHPIVKLFLKHGHENLRLLNQIINEDCFDEGIH